MFLVEPDELDRKDTDMVFCLSCIIRNVRDKETQTNAVLFELADVANVMM